MSDVIWQADNIRATDYYKSLRKTITQKLQTVDDGEEAEEAAWEERKHQLRLFIKKNKETINEKIQVDED